MQKDHLEHQELTLANVMRDVCDSTLDAQTLGQVHRLLDSVKHIEFPVRVVRYNGKLGLMFDVEYYYLENDDNIPRERVMDWWLNECDHNTLAYEPTRQVVEAFVRDRYGSLGDRMNESSNGIYTFFTTSESFVEFRVFVPSEDVFFTPGIVDGVNDELAHLYSY